MLHVLHLSPDLNADILDRMSSLEGEEAHLAEARRLLGVPGAYLPMAILPDGREPHEALEATSEQASLNWRILPPPGVFPSGIRFTAGDKFIEDRPTGPGDIICADGRFLLVTAYGLQHLEGVKKHPKLPDITEFDGFKPGPRIHIDMAEQRSLVSEVMKRMIDGDTCSMDAAEEVFEQSGLDPFRSSVIAREAVRQAVLQAPERFYLRDGPLSCCRGELLHRGMVAPSDEAIRAIVELDPVLCEKLNHWYPDLGDGFDTAEREDFLNMIALHFTGVGWPSNSDSEEDTKQMAEALVDGFQREGWTLQLRQNPPSL